MKDSFLNEFLNDTEQIGTDTDELHELDQIQNMPDDDSLSTYLSGGTYDVAADRPMKEKDPLFHFDPQPHEQSDFEFGSEFGTTAGGMKISRQPPRSIIIVTKPPTVQRGSKTKGITNSKRKVSARERPEKNKQCGLGPEDSVIKKLTEENCLLKKLGTEQKNHIGKLQREVDFLRSMIENKSALSPLLQNGVTLTTSSCESNR